MEPSWGRRTLEEFQALVNRGFKNFVGSDGDSILQYCAYTFLCHESFTYQITDISKGAMKTTVASVQRKIRYANWLSNLKRELEFFGNPQLIAIGSTANNFLNKTSLKVRLCLTHFSQQNSRIFRKYYEQHPNKFLADGIHIALKDFVARMMAELNYDPEMRTFILKGLFNNELSIWKRGMFLSYMDQFSAMAAANKLFGPTAR
jgi:hypothetical protein